MDILLSDEEIVGGMGDTHQPHPRDRAIAKFQAKKIVEWGNGECRVHTYYPKLPYWPRRRCNECWQSLKKAVE